MANSSIKLSDLPEANTIAGSDRILILTDPGGNPNTETISKTNLFSNVTTVAEFSNVVTFTANTTVNTFHISDLSTPANSTANAINGRMWFDSSYIYVATANNTIKRVALSSF